MSETRKMFAYLRTAQPGARAGGPCPGAASASNGFMAYPALLEDARDHLVERRVLDAHVDDGVAIEDLAEHLGDPGAVHLQVDDRPLPVGDLAVAAQLARRD